MYLETTNEVRIGAEEMEHLLREEDFNCVWPYQVIFNVFVGTVQVARTSHSSIDYAMAKQMYNDLVSNVKSAARARDSRATRVRCMFITNGEREQCYEREWC